MVKLITEAFAVSLLCAWHCVKNFAWVISLKPYNNPKRCEDLLVALFYR